MCNLFDDFPNLRNEKIEIRKMVEGDVAALFDISYSDAVYRYISPFLYRKSEKFLQTAIKNFGGRDFDKKKMIIAGIYLQKAPVGLWAWQRCLIIKRKQMQLPSDIVSMKCIGIKALRSTQSSLW